MISVRVAVVLVLIVATWPQALLAQNSFCRVPDAVGNSLRGRLERELTSDDEMQVRNRQAADLPLVTANEVQFVADTATCRQAAEAFDSVRVSLGSSSQPRPVYVIRAGTATYFVIDPEVRAGEYYTCMVFTAQWEYRNAIGL